MAGSIYDWSLTESNNDSADGDINWVENQLPSTVNNSARVMMKRTKELINDLTAVKTTAGTASALTLTAQSSFTSLGDGRVVSFHAHTTANAGATLNANGLGGRGLRKLTPTGDVAINDTDILQSKPYIAIYSAAADSASGGWVVINPSGVLYNPSITGGLSVSGNVSITGSFSADSYDLLPPGTKLLFPLTTTAPTGWTKITTHNDAALRVVSGSAGDGGSVNFSTAFTDKTNAIGETTAAGTVGGTTLTADQIPSHNHTFSGSGTTSSDGAHTHSVSGTAASAGAHTHNVGAQYVGSGNSNVGGYILPTGTGATTSSDGAHTHSVSGTAASAGAHTHTYSVSGTTSSIGSGQSHNHSFSGTPHNHTLTGMNLNVKYVDAIIAEKAA